MKISINNGATFTTVQTAIESLPWAVIVNNMDDETREQVAAELVPCSPADFLARYLDLAPADLIIG